MGFLRCSHCAGVWELGRLLDVAGLSLDTADLIRAARSLFLDHLAAMGLLPSDACLRSTALECLLGLLNPGCGCIRKTAQRLRHFSLSLQAIAGDGGSMDHRCRVSPRLDTRGLGLHRGPRSLLVRLGDLLLVAFGRRTLLNGQPTRGEVVLCSSGS